MAWSPKIRPVLRKRWRNPVVRLFHSYICRLNDHPKSDRPGRVIDILLRGRLTARLDDKEREFTNIQRAWAAASTTYLHPWRHQTFGVKEEQVVWGQQVRPNRHNDIAWMHNGTMPDNMLWFTVRGSRVAYYGEGRSHLATVIYNVVTPIVTFSSAEFAGWIAGLRLMSHARRDAFFEQGATLLGEKWDATPRARFAILTRLWQHRVLHGQTFPEESEVYYVRVAPALTHCDITHYFGGLHV